MTAESRKTRGAGALPARIAALALALLMAAAYLVFTTEEQPISIRFVGRDKAEIPTGEALTWSWEPESDHVSELSLTLSGKKKAAGTTVTAALTGPDASFPACRGARPASASSRSRPASPTTRTGAPAGSLSRSQRAAT